MPQGKSMFERTNIDRSVLVHICFHHFPMEGPLKRRMKAVDPKPGGADKRGVLFDRRLLAKYTHPLVLALRPCGGYIYLAGHVPSVGCRFFRQLVADQPGGS